MTWRSWAEDHHSEIEEHASTMFVYDDSMCMHGEYDEYYNIKSASPGAFGWLCLRSRRCACRALVSRYVREVSTCECGRRDKREAWTERGGAL